MKIRKIGILRNHEVCDSNGDEFEVDIYITESSENQTSVHVFNVDNNEEVHNEFEDAEIQEWIDSAKLRDIDAELSDKPKIYELHEAYRAALFGLH